MGLKKILKTMKETIESYLMMKMNANSENRNIDIIS